MLTGLYTRYEFESDLQRFLPWQNESKSFEKMIKSYFQRIRPDCRFERFYATGTQKKNWLFIADGFCEHCNTVFEAMDCFHHYCPFQEARLVLTEEDIQHETKKRETDEMRTQYIEEKGYTIVEKWKCEWWKPYKADVSVNEHLNLSFPIIRPMHQDQLLYQKNHAHCWVTYMVISKFHNI